MLVSYKMEPERRTWAAVRLGTLSEERVHASLFQFTEEGRIGFQLWRWAKSKDGWKRSQSFQQPDIPRIRELLLRVEGYALESEPPSAPQALEFDLKSFAADNPVQRFENGSIQVTVCGPKKPTGPDSFVLRRTVEGTTETGNWFFLSELPALEEVLRLTAAWFQQHSSSPQ
jgi:hypothetical protein